MPKKVYRCRRPLCENRVPNTEQYCCYECQQADKPRQRGLETREALRQYYPIPTRPTDNRIHGKNRRD